MKLNPLILTLTTLTLNIMVQFKPGSTNPSDTTCLTQLHSSFLNPTHLTNWTPPFFSNPCYNGFDSYLLGITCNNGRIYRLSLPNLNLSGTVSQYVSQCTDLQALDLSSNSLTGTIPDTITDLTNLAVLNLSNNKLTGVIPANLYLCAYLNVIDLHGNLLEGTLSPQLGLLNRLKTIDVSYNKLSGMIPASLGSRRNVSDFIGNKDLFGYPLGAYKRDKGLSVMAIVGIGLGSGLLSLVISFAIVCVWLKVSEHKMAALEEAKISHLMPDY